jgi:hypothetical protein
LPTSNCGFTISTEVTVRLRDADQRREHERERDEARVADNEIDRFTADVVEVRVRTLVGPSP